MLTLSSFLVSVIKLKSCLHESVGFNQIDLVALELIRFDFRKFPRNVWQIGGEPAEKEETRVHLFLLLFLVG